MTDYISRETAVEIAEKYGITAGSALGRHSGIADCIASEIYRVPAADIEPVVHGRWVYKRRRSGGFHVRTGLLKNGERVKCLSTNMKTPWNRFVAYAEFAMMYCPHCGAKMGEEV